MISLFSFIIITQDLKESSSKDLFFFVGRLSGGRRIKSFWTLEKADQGKPEDNNLPV